MEWFEAIVLGLVQGLTEFLPVSSSGHLVIARELLGVDAPRDLMFEVTVHAATVLSTIIVFRRQIWQLLCGLFKFRYNDETDYILKIIVSMIPILVVGIFFKDQVEALFGSLTGVAVALLVTAALLVFSDFAGKVFTWEKSGGNRTVEGSLQLGIVPQRQSRNGIAWWQALVVGIGQAFAAAPGLSRSGTTIATGLICGVRRDVMAQFSFLMVIVPILGEAFLDLVGGGFASSGIGALPLLLGFASAFLSGLFACKVMVALVRRARLCWFALYCALVAILIFVLK